MAEDRYKYERFQSWIFSFLAVSVFLGIAALLTAISAAYYRTAGTTPIAWFDATLVQPADLDNGGVDFTVRRFVVLNPGPASIKHATLEIDVDRRFDQKTGQFSSKDSEGSQSFFHMIASENAETSAHWTGKSTKVVATHLNPLLSPGERVEVIFLVAERNWSPTRAELRGSGPVQERNSDVSVSSPVRWNSYVGIVFWIVTGLMAIFSHRNFSKFLESISTELTAKSKECNDKDSRLRDLETNIDRQVEKIVEATLKNSQANQDVVIAEILSETDPNAINESVMGDLRMILKKMERKRQLDSSE